MATQTVGIREFREKLSTYVLEAEAPIAITRHGDTVGLFIPTRRKRSAEDRRRLEEVAARVHGEMDAAGVTEDDVIADFKQLREELLKANL